MLPTFDRLQIIDYVFNYLKISKYLKNHTICVLKNQTYKNQFVAINS